MKRHQLAPFVLWLAGATSCTSTPATSGEVGFEVDRAMAVLDQGDEIARAVVGVLRASVPAADLNGDGWVRDAELALGGALVLSGLLPLFTAPQEPAEQ